MSAQILQFKRKMTQWEALVAHFDAHPNKKGYYQGLLKWLKNKEQNMTPNSLLKDWFDLKNKIRFVERKLKE